MKRNYIPSAEKVAEFINRMQPMKTEKLPCGTVQISTTNHRGDRYYAFLTVNADLPKPTDEKAPGE